MVRSVASRHTYRLAKYLTTRGASIAISLLVAVFLVVFVANLGGKLDEILFHEIKTLQNNRLLEENYRKQVENLCSSVCTNKLGEGATADEFSRCMSECKENYIIDEALRIMKTQYGIDLDQPVIFRIFSHWLRAISLNLGNSMFIFSLHTRQRDVRTILAEAVPQTVLLFTTANIIIFFTNISLGLWLSRRYGRLADKVAVSLAPLSSMPGWFYGMVLLLIFGIWLRVFPDGGMMSEAPIEDPLVRAIDVLYHMALPIISWMVAYIPIGAYSYRTFFLIFSTEEYVEYARARGVPESIVQRRYILRPTLPPIITTLVLTLISSWMGAIITETIFRWPGLGSVLYNALRGGSVIDVPVIVGVNTIYAYLLAASVLSLDIIYIILDPRIRLGGE